MGLLEELTGGGQRQQEYGNFIQRYNQGAPHEGISDEETAKKYQEVCGQVDPQTYQQSAQESFTRMGEGDRAQYAQQLQAAAGQQGVPLGGYSGATDPQSLAQLTSQVHQHSPGLLGSLLGDGGAGMLGSMLGGGGGGGGGGLGGMLGGGGGGNPIMRAALGGITAMAAQRMMGGQGGAGGLLGKILG